MVNKIWNVKPVDHKLAQSLLEEFEISSNLAKLLVNRNINKGEIQDYISPQIENLDDPFKIKDMEKFTERVLKAVENKEKICIYGDYDVDGITSITVLYKFLEELGADVCFYLPNRLIDGYGLSSESIKNIKEKENMDLIITVDCGITATAEVAYAKELGIDVIITDHHECGEELPECVAIINPKQKDDTSNFKFHAGVGVAFKCITALSEKLKLPAESYLKYLDIVALGTIADIVPLVGENRIISKYGLEMMKVTKNIGLASLIELCDLNELDSIFVSFSLAPRINACGRMGDARLAVDMLLSKSKNKANVMALKLDELNKLRQDVERKIYEEAITYIEQTKKPEEASIVIYNEHWHNGVMGIVASKLVSLYNKPVILLTKENGVIRGSSRCPQKFSLYDSLTECKSLLTQFGGHEFAAGLTIEEKNIEPFRVMFDKVCQKYKKALESENIDIDLELFKNDLNTNMIKDVARLKPFGQSNPEPLFIYKNLKVNAISTVKDGKHLKLILKDSNALMIGLAFSAGYRRDELIIGDKIDIVGNLSVNKYNGHKTLQFIIKDFKKSN